MRLLICAFTLLVAASGADDTSHLGQLTWCDTMCLCIRSTLDTAHCFSNREIYSLVQIPDVVVNRLERNQYKPQENLMWCNDTCLCHRSSQSTFKCIVSADKILDLAPHLAPYLGTRFNTTMGQSVTTESSVELSDTSEETTMRKSKKKHRKNRKNKKKWQKHHGSAPEVAVVASTESPVDYISVNRAMIVGPSVFQQSKYSEMIDTTRSSVPPEAHVADRVEVVAEISKDLERLRLTVQQLREKVNYNDHYVEELRQTVTFNTFVNYVFSAVTAGLFLGFLILSIVMCCRKDPGKRSEKAHCESINKGNISEAW